MYLKEIKAHGFKSFADKINIELSKDITGIVGPNGSGKSNVVDAVRWVLGEQSVKSLRGDGGMSDVIFQGSKNRSPSNSASVTLVFDNNDHYLPIDYTDVSVKRRVYIDGTNEYFLNEEKVRLKDILDLFMDSGISKESFSIISQGKIEEILVSKPQDRRTIFEEAAGVLKYKKRKEDALRKLEKTHDNMNRVKDIINELETQVEPLKIQKEKTIRYNKAKEELESIEIALITSDITNINYYYQDKKGKIEKLEQEILDISTNTSINDTKIEKIKLSISKKEEELKILQAELLEKSSEVERINSKKNIIIERKKYQVEDAKLHTSLVNLEEEKLRITNHINIIDQELIELQNQINKQEEKYSIKDNQLKEKFAIKNKLNDSLALHLRTKNNLEARSVTLKEIIANNANIPYAVKSVLGNPKLRGIHNIIGQIVDTSDQYKTALSIGLGASTNYVVVDNESSAKEAINYLKLNNLGRVTFFPLNVIKPRYIDIETSEAIAKFPGYVGILADLTSYDKVYHNIVLNQIGNTIVVNNIDNANNIAKKINYRYRIVTLEGEIINVGGSVTGGSEKSHNIITDKIELDKNEKELKNVIDQIQLIESRINENDEIIKQFEDEIYIITKEKNSIVLNQTTKLEQQTVLKNDLQKNIDEINGTNNVLNSTLEKAEQDILKEYYEALNECEVLKHTIEIKNKDIIEEKDILEEATISLRKENSNIINKNNELKELEIEVNRDDVKLDSLLSTLSETYNMTYENAVSIYHLEIDKDIARNKVNNLKKTLRDIGEVNLAAPSEYDRISTRYEFLINQSNDLSKAENTLLEIIAEMDTVMKKEFIDAFKIIEHNFSETFKKLFNGGHAELKLTDEENILETGIEIVASPPGKNLKSISLLSGGEKTLTAISLLFGILCSRPMPFAILDEVEAALDETNVDTFGKYISTLKDKTQFILITHKKKTMEYVDTLYGITMQETGVSKLVSVRLDEFRKDDNK